MYYRTHTVNPIWIICLSFFIVNTISSKKEKLSINALVKLAQKNREDLKAFKYAKRASKNIERAAFAGYLPQIQFGTRFGRTVPEIMPRHQDGTPISYGGTMSSRRITFNVSQLLLDGGIPILDYKIAQEGTQIVKAQEKTAGNTIRIQTETAFLETQQILLEEELIKSQDLSSKVTFEQISGKRTVELINNTQWLTALAQYAKQQSDVKNYKYDVQQKISKLQRETNTSIQTDEINLSIKDLVNIRLRPLNYYIKQAQKNRPELIEQKHLIRQARYSDKRYGRSYVPSLGIYGRGSDLQLGKCSAGRLAGWGAGVELSWNFDGFGSASISEQYRNQNLQYKLQKRDLELNIDQQVEQAYLQIKNTINKAKAALYNYTQARSNLRLTSKKYKIGQLTIADLTQAKTDYEKANFELISLKIGVRSTYQNLLFVCGYSKTLT